MNGDKAAMISLCCKFYNQKRYVREALGGAFAQTYRPLEIVICDDCSSDGTWEEIESLKAGCPGDVALIVHRNERNLGNLGNWQTCCELAHGELLVKADGDDVSCPDRVERIAAAWIADGRRAPAVCHSGWQIGPRGERYGRLRRVTAEWSLGAAMAYSPRLYREFPRISENEFRRMDDDVYTNRALLLGDVLAIPDRLVYYRIGVGATSSLNDVRNRIVFCNRGALAILDITRADLESIRSKIGETEYREKLAWLEGRRSYFDARIGQLTGKTLGERLDATKRLGGDRRIFSVARYLQLAFLLPRPLGDLMLRLYLLLRNAYWRIGF